MYLRFLEGLVTYVKVLNDACQGLDENDFLTPYLNHVPVLLEDDICGFLRDDIGGEFMFEPATEQEREWWNNRPWAKRPFDRKSVPES